MYQLWVRYERGGWQMHDFYGNGVHLQRALDSLYNLGNKELGPVEEHNIVKVEVL